MVVLFCVIVMQVQCLLLRNSEPRTTWRQTPSEIVNTVGAAASSAVACVYLSCSTYVVLCDTLWI